VPSCQGQRNLKERHGVKCNSKSVTGAQWTLSAVKRLNSRPVYRPLDVRPLGCTSSNAEFADAYLDRGGANPG